jgi:hypothetical protein
MSSDFFKIPKSSKQITLWVHPGGRVIGSIFLREQSPLHVGNERVDEAINEDDQFLVLQMSEPEELRFYNRSSIVRIEYEEELLQSVNKIEPVTCRLDMMDGSVIIGTIKTPMPPGHTRVLDHLNTQEERFLKLHMEDNTVYLVNRSYIIHATDLGNPGQ